MGNSAAHQENSNILNTQDLAPIENQSDIPTTPKFGRKSSSSSFVISNSLLSFRVSSGGSVRSPKKSPSYSQAKTVWPHPSHEIPFLPEFPVRTGINEKSFNVISVVSSGAFGRVLKVVLKEDESKYYAMKVMSKSMMYKENLVQQVKTEAQIQVMCDHHPFLVRGPFRWQNKRNLFIVSDFIDGGDLHQLWQESGSFDEDLIKIYIAELAIVLDFLHNAGIVYRDLKMENILIDEKGHLKLIDFGLSKWLSFGERCYTLCGTRQYMAPEVLRLEPYSHPVDWWSLGVVLYALLQGDLPFCNVSDSRNGVPFHDDAAAAAAVDKAPSSAGQPARRLVAGLLTVDPAKRLKSLRTLKNHAFFHHFDFESLRSKKIDPLPLLAKQRAKRRITPPDDGDENFFDSCVSSS